MELSMNKANYQDGQKYLHEALSDVEIEETVTFFGRILKEE